MKYYVVGDSNERTNISQNDSNELPQQLVVKINEQNCLFELRREKTNILVSDLVRHKAGCTTTEDG